MRRLIIAAAVVTVSGCAMLQGGLNSANRAGQGDIAGAVREGDRAAGELNKLKKEADKCKELDKKVVTYEEEWQIGGAVALALGKNQGGVFIEQSPDIPEGAINAAMWDKKKPTPATGDKTALTRYVDELGKGLAAASSRPDIAWTFVVLDSKNANAFSAPGGYVFITTGMIEKLDNEAQLAAVLAHEIGHVTGKHALTAYKAAKVTSCNLAFAAKITAQSIGQVVGPAADRLIGEWGGLFGRATFNVDAASADLIEGLTDKFAEGLTSVGMGKDFEYAADRTAFELMMFGGYDPGEFEKLIKRLPDGGGVTPHPSNADRIAELKKYREKEFAGFTFDGKSPPLDPRSKVVKK